MAIMASQREKISVYYVKKIIWILRFMWETSRETMMRPCRLGLPFIHAAYGFGRDCDHPVEKIDALIGSAGSGMKKIGIGANME